MVWSRLQPFLLAATLVTALAGQDDLRDKVTKKDGKVVTGRVAEPFAAEELLVVQGGKRTRIALDDVAETELVADRLREFFSRRQRHQGSARAQRFLVDWADGKELPAIARLLATALVLQDDDDEGLHEYLGHRKRGKQWLWPHDGRFVTRDKLAAMMADEPLELRGERCVVKSHSGLVESVNALLDLEQLGVVWFEQYGRALGLREVLEPIEVEIFQNAEQFPKWGFRPRPFFEPPPHADVGRTFYAGPAPERPELLFFVGTQGLLYRTMIGDVNRQDSRDRACAWLEVGLGMYMEHTMHGPAGFATAGDLRAKDVQALRALNRGYRLTHLLHLPMYGSFYLTDDTATATNWSGAGMFVAWLLKSDNQPKTREPFLQFVRAALAERQGDSSSAFDRIMGQRVEQMDEPWRAWLNRLVH
jgi:hypothetical protein